MEATLEVTKLIKWRLRIVMADRKMSVTKLAGLVGVHRATLSEWKNADAMPFIDGDRLNSLLKSLECELADLIIYSPDPTQGGEP